MPLALSGLLMAAIWLLATAVRPKRLVEKGATLWLSIPLAGMIGIALTFGQIGLKIRIALCESSLRDYVEGVPQDHGDQTHRWVGLFHVDETENFKGAVYCYTSQGFLNQ
jgi:hypothetical protein